MTESEENDRGMERGCLTERTSEMRGEEAEDGGKGGNGDSAGFAINGYVSSVSPSFFVEEERLLWPLSRLGTVHKKSMSIPYSVSFLSCRIAAIIKLLQLQNKKL